MLWTSKVKLPRKQDGEAHDTRPTLPHTCFKDPDGPAPFGLLSGPLLPVAATLSPGEVLWRCIARPVTNKIWNHADLRPQNIWDMTWFDSWCNYTNICHSSSFSDLFPSCRTSEGTIIASYKPLSWVTVLFQQPLERRPFGWKSQANDSKPVDTGVVTQISWYCMCYMCHHASMYSVLVTFLKTTCNRWTAALEHLTSCVRSTYFAVFLFV